MALLVGVVAQASVLFDGAVFVAQVRDTFRPLENLLPEGGVFDHGAAAWLSGDLNGTDEPVIVEMVTRDSISRETARLLREDLTWEEVGVPPLLGVMILRCIRDVETWWESETTQDQWFKFSGNLKVHLETCTTVSMNQS